MRFSISNALANYGTHMTNTGEYATASEDCRFTNQAALAGTQ